MTRAYPLAVVLSAYHNKLMCTIGELREFLNYMTRHDIALWEIPAARTMTARSLARQFPWLKDIPLPPGFKTDSGNCGRFVRHVAARIGTFTLDVAHLRSDAYRPQTGVAAIATLRARQ